MNGSGWINGYICTWIMRELKCGIYEKVDEHLHTENGSIYGRIDSITEVLIYIHLDHGL